MTKEYMTVATFQSKSKGNVWHRVSRDEKGDLSCTCPQWKFRPGPNNKRSCSHVRKVLADVRTRTSGTVMQKETPMTIGRRVLRK